MNRLAHLWTLILVLLLFLAASQSVKAAGELSLPFWSVDGGGGISQSGSYSLTGTFGQADAGAMQGGKYMLSGGFWRGEVVVADSFSLHLPLIVR